MNNKNHPPMKYYIGNQYPSDVERGRYLRQCKTCGKLFKSDDKRKTDCVEDSFDDSRASNKEDRQ